MHYANLRWIILVLMPLVFVQSSAAQFGGNAAPNESVRSP